MIFMKIAKDVVIVTFLIGIVIGGFGTYFAMPKYINQTQPSCTINVSEICKGLIMPLNHEQKIEMNVPAVDAEGRGVIAKLTTRIRPGSGLVLVSINDVLAEPDTLHSARSAARVAGNYAKINISNYDIIYSINVNASVVGGPSAGLAMAVSTVLALRNETINNSIMMTGTINTDGSVGPVGAVPEKAEASKKAGATLFLVPLGHSSDIQYKEEKKCENYGSIEWCQIEYIPQRINIGQKYNITLVEVQNLSEAMKYFEQ